jgi:predicted TIM-barrel fold metal-dependent hydrolase
MALLRFVDAHIHLWDLNQIRYPWLTGPFSDAGVNGSVEPIAKSYGLSDYLLDAQKYRPLAAVHIEAGADPRDALKETEWLQVMANGSGMPQAIVAYAPLHEVGVESLLAAHCAHKNVRGIRQILNWHPNSYYTYTPRNYMDDPQWEKGFAVLSKYNLSFDLQIYPLQMQQASRFARKYDQIPLMLNHTGMPINDHGESQNRWVSGLKYLAQNPNVAIKISGFGFVDRKWTAQSIRPLILRAIDIFGPRRVMFASDFPTDKLFSTFDHVMSAFDEITASFSEAERDQMFADNALRHYRINW